MFAFLSVTGREANSRREGSMFRALGPGSVSSFLKVILDVVYFVLWLFAILAGLVILGLLLISFDPQVLPAPVLADVQILGRSPGPVAALLLVGTELNLIGLLVIVQRLRRIFGTLTAGDPFHPDNVRRLRIVALMLALLEIGRYVFAAIHRFLLHEAPPPGDNFNPTAWFAVLVVMVLAEVFREGARLRREAELTI
jgi:tellurite resistance protein TehA-like permease